MPSTKTEKLCLPSGRQVTSNIIKSWCEHVCLKFVCPSCWLLGQGWNKCNIVMSHCEAGLTSQTASGKADRKHTFCISRWFQTSVLHGSTIPFHTWLTMAARLSFSATPKECARAFRTSCIAKAVCCKLVTLFAIEHQRKEDWGSEWKWRRIYGASRNKWKQLDAAARFASDQVCAVQVFLAHLFMVTRTTWKSLIGLIGIMNIHEHSWTFMKWIKMDIDGSSMIKCSSDASGSFGMFWHQPGRTRGSVKRLSMVWKVDDSRSVLWSKTGVSFSHVEILMLVTKNMGTGGARNRSK